MSIELARRLERVQNELDALRDQFSNYAYSVSHDLSAPFRQIDGFANIILSKHEDEFDEKTKRHMGIIIKGAENGAQIIESQLEYSRLCTQAMQASRVDCNILVAALLAQLSDVIQDSNAEVVCSELPVIEGDASQLGKLFIHLIHNALHYRNESSHPVVTIDAKETTQGWEFCISDNGIGIAENQQEKVFSVLRRAVAKDTYTGSGMGLPIAKCVVQHHGGEIWIESTVDNGCSLYFTLQAQVPAE